MPEYFMHVQCTPPGATKRGTYIANDGGEGHKLISPVFDGLTELFPWMKQNGWKVAEYPNGEFTPWRVEKVA